MTLKQFAEDYIKGYNSPLERAKITNFVDAWEDFNQYAKEVAKATGSFGLSEGESKRAAQVMSKKTTTNNKKK